MVKYSFAQLKQHLNELRKVEDVYKIQKDIYYSVKFWSPLKLIALMLYADFYTKVASKHFQHIFYIDLLADSGINKIEDTGDFIVGSPIIASRLKKFEKLLLVEMNQDRSKALESRLKELPTLFEVFKDNCNKEIDKILENISIYSSHYLAFIDCEGLEVEWNTMEKLLQKKGDIIFNFQTQEIQRVWGLWKVGKISEDKLKKFFGDDTWKEAKNSEDLLGIYKDKIKKYRELIETINVSSKNFHYNLIFAVKKTRSNSPWFAPVLGHLKNYTETNTAESVKLALDILSGRSTDLEKFISIK